MSLPEAWSCKRTVKASTYARPERTQLPAAPFAPFTCPVKLRLQLLYMTKLSFIPGCALLIALVGCSESTDNAKKAEKPPEPVTGESALWKMYQTARTWASDAQILRMNSIELPEVPSVPGKAAAWEVMLTSADKGRRRSYTYSVIEAQGNLHQGAFAGLEEPWSGPGDQSSPFLIAAVKIDSDAAYKTAKTKAGDYEKKNPNKPITFLLERTRRFPDPAWRVIWGNSVSTSDFSVYVDASTGEYLETLH
jgi:hypothetical protein